MSEARNIALDIAARALAEKVDREIMGRPLAADADGREGSIPSVDLGGSTPPPAPEFLTDRDPEDETP